MNRREFIEVSGASLVVASTRRLGALAPEAGKPWYETMQRCGQVNFNEQDPVSMNADEWMDYFASLKVNVVLLNGGGIMAFYPTQVPYQHRSEFLGSRDLFGEMLAAGRKRNMRVVARMDCNYAYEEAFQAHPEWFQFGADGSPTRHPECHWLYKTCMFGTYFTQQMPAIYREINQRYAPDGFYTNGWPGTEALEVCHCPNCQKIYREQTGGVPPQTTDVQSQVYRKYYEVYMDRIALVWKLWQDTVREKSADSVYVGNLGGGIRTVKDLNRLSGVAAWFPTGARGSLRHARPPGHQRDRRLQQWTDQLETLEQDSSRDNPVDGAGYGQRHGALVPLAGRPSGGYPLAADRTGLFRLAGRQPATFPEPALARRPGGALPPEHDRLLWLQRNQHQNAEWRDHRLCRVPRGNLCSFARRPLPIRFCSSGEPDG
jgi:hypothetical protein